METNIGYWIRPIKPDQGRWRNSVLKGGTVVAERITGGRASARCAT